MSGHRRILIVARHPSAAGGAIALARAGREMGHRMDVMADGPAWPILRESGVGRVRRYDGPRRIDDAEWRRPAAATARVEAMVTWLMRDLARARPDVVLLTDATEQIGPDQASAVAAARLGIPSVRVRDAWGTAAGLETRRMRGRVPITLQREALATRYLEIDAMGARLSHRRLGIPRGRLDVMDGLYTLDRVVGRATRARRIRARRAIGVGRDVPLVVFFTQPTRRERAECDALDAFVDGMNAADLGARGVVLATQEHPREADPSDGRRGLHWTWARATRRYRGSVIDLTGRVLAQRTLAFEDTLLAADVFGSSYSNASIEATALGATANADLPDAWRGIGCHVACPARVRQTMAANRAGLRAVPFASGAMPIVRRASEIAPLLSRLLFTPAARRPFFAAMRRRRHLGRTCARVVRAAIALTD